MAVRLMVSQDRALRGRQRAGFCSLLVGRKAGPPDWCTEQRVSAPAQQALNRLLRTRFDALVWWPEPSIELGSRFLCLLKGEWISIRSPLFLGKGKGQAGTASKQRSEALRWKGLGAGGLAQSPLSRGE